MPLPHVLHPPETPRGMDEWGFQHAHDHTDIVEKIRAVTGVVLPVLVLDPIDPADFHGFALRHQDMHDSANGILGTAGSDLQTVDWENDEERESWYWLNYQEHLAWHKKLGS